MSDDQKEIEDKKPAPRPHGPAYYGNSRPRYAAYGGSAYDGVLPYYSNSSSSANGETEENNSVLGPLSISRVIRVMLQKWPTLVVSVLLGLGAGFAYYKAAPVIYSAQSIIEMQIAPSRVLGGNGPVYNDPNQQGSITEIFNTRLAMLRSPSVVKQVADRVRADNATLKTLTDAELYKTIGDSTTFSLQRQSRLVVIAVRHSSPEVCQAIANSYAKTANEFSKQQNIDVAEASVDYLKTTLDQASRKLSEADDALLNFGVENRISSLTIEKDSLNATFQNLRSAYSAMQTTEQAALEIYNILVSISKNPDSINQLPDGIPHASEITAARLALTTERSKLQQLRVNYTDKHDKVIAQNIIVQDCEKRLKEAILTSKETAQANLMLKKKATEDILARSNEIEKKLGQTGVDLATAESTLKQLELQQQIALENYQAVVRRMNEVRGAADEASATIRVIEEARLPERQISPDPRMAFSAGPILGLVVGFIFVLILDRVEDKITSTEDIERHMGTKVLALLPHVPRITRNQLVTLSADKKFSRLAEAFAGLRGLLESPRYIDITKVILVVSTQPEEGKTITSSNLATTYAMSGKKTLLVDFDLRRPRVARMFGKSDILGHHNSLLDVLDKNDPDLFDNLPIDSGYDNLTIIGSRATSHISPANVIGSDAIPKFFEWARAHFEHIVIDSPPFGLVSDALALGTLSDSVIIVCRPEKSRYGVVRHCLRSLSESGSRVMGVVVNDVDFGRSSTFSSYSYNSYGHYSHYGRYGRYGRYGYGGGYYKRSAGDDGNDEFDTSKMDGAEADEAGERQSEVRTAESDAEPAQKADSSAPVAETKTPPRTREFRSSHEKPADLSGGVLDVDDDE